MNGRRQFANCLRFEMSRLTTQHFCYSTIDLHGIPAFYPQWMGLVAHRPTHQPSTIQTSIKASNKRSIKNCFKRIHLDIHEQIHKIYQKLSSSVIHQNIRTFNNFNNTSNTSTKHPFRTSTHPSKKTNTSPGFPGLGKCPCLGILNITFKYLLEIISYYIPKSWVM